MREKVTNSEFREFAKARGDRREVWFHYYFPVFFRAVHINGFFLIAGGILFAFGWYFLMKKLGIPQDAPLVRYPLFADFFVVFALMAFHSKRG